MESALTKYCYFTATAPLKCLFAVINSKMISGEGIGQSRSYFKRNLFLQQIVIIKVENELKMGKLRA